MPAPVLPFVFLCIVRLGAHASADLVLNEVLYDPPGADGDGEFVELFNPTASPVTLDGVELWFLNAGRDDDVRRVWTAPAGVTVAPGSFHLIAETDVAGADARTTLDLQNGPDALWLVRRGVPVDAVAWGDDAAAGGEGRAAPDVTGASIGRVPDGRDSGDNAADFEALPTPTPGRVNRREVAFVPRPARVDPPWRADGGRVVWTPRWVASGWAPHQTASVQVQGIALDLSAAAGDTVAFEIPRELAVGDHVLVHDAAPPGAAPPDTTRLRVGPLAVRLTEIQARPAPGEPEWVEIANVGSTAVDLAGWSLADADRARSIGPVRAIEPGARWILTADPDAWAAVHGTGIVAFRPEGGWSTLNDGRAGDPAAADEVRLIDADGRTVDRAPYRRDDLGDRGETLQRTDVVVDGAVRWMRTAGPATPGRPHPSEDFVPAGAALSVGPDPFSPDGDGRDDLLQVVLEDPGNGLQARVFDLFGEVVRELDGAIGPARAHWQWDGTDARGRQAPVGAYVVHVRRGDDGAVWRRVVGLGRR